MSRTKKQTPLIPIGSKYRIGLDGRNVTVFQKTKAGGKKLGGTWRVVGYYSSYKNALEGLVDHVVIQPDLIDLKEVVKRQAELYQLIESLKTPPEFVLHPVPESVDCENKAPKRRGGIKHLARKKRGLKMAKRKSQRT